MAPYSTIMLKGEQDGPAVEELEAYAAITPGMIIEGRPGYDQVRPHSVPSGTVKPVIVALESELEGKGITDAYAAGEHVRVWHPEPGDIFYGLLADGESVEKWDKLTSNGNGYLKKSDQDSKYDDEICGIARDTVDRSSSSGGDTNTTGRIAVEAV